MLAITDNHFVIRSQCPYYPLIVKGKQSQIGGQGEIKLSGRRGGG